MNSVTKAFKHTKKQTHLILHIRKISFQIYDHLGKGCPLIKMLVPQNEGPQQKEAF